MAVRPLQYPLITAVSDRRRLAAHDDEACHRLVEWAAAVARAGVDIIQVREQGLTDRCTGGHGSRVSLARLPGRPRWC